MFPGISLRVGLPTIAFLLASVLFVGRSSGQLVTERSTGGDVSTRADEYCRAEETVNRFSGSVLVAKGDQVLFAKGYGLANVEHGVLNSPQTIFRLGSITKQFTAMAILILQEQGKLSVDDLVSKHVEECPEAWSEVTVHQLLSHTSGIPNFTGLPEYRSTMMLPSPPAKTLDRVRNLALEFKPGEKFAYSNSGYVLLGQIIEKVAGTSYEEFLRKSIFEPLDMKKSGYDSPETILTNRAAGYRRAGEKLSNAAYLDMTIPHAAGSLYSTVEDLHRWSRALDAGKLVSGQGREKMFTPVKGTYGYGWVIDQKFGRRCVMHGGGINGFVTHIARFPEEELCVVVLCNSEGAGAGMAGNALAAIALGEKYELPQERKFVAVEGKVLDNYVGTYKIEDRFEIVVSRDGVRLMAQPTGQPKVHLRAESEAKFFIQEVNATVTFGQDEKGDVSHLILRQGGRDIQAMKVK